MHVVWVCQKGLVPVFLLLCFLFFLLYCTLGDIAGSSVTENFCLPFGNQLCVCVCFWTVCLWLSEQRPSTASLSASRWWTSNLLVTHLHTQSSYSSKHSQSMRSPHENLLTWVCRKSKLSLHYQIKVANQIKGRWVAVRWHWWYFKDSPYIIRCWLPKALRLCYFYHLASRTTGFRRAISYMILNCGFYVDWCNLPLFRSTFNIHIFN